MYKCQVTDNVYGIIGMSLTLFRFVPFIPFQTHTALNLLQYRMGIAFDPMELNTELPSVYIAHCMHFHQGVASSSGKSINGRISRIFGSNLDQIEDIITGLPTSDHDHGINAIEFGNHGNSTLTLRVIPTAAELVKYRRVICRKIHTYLVRSL